jgi:hypothetical protein
MDWIVVLEFEAESGEVIDLAELEALLAALAEFEPSGLYSSDRYAVQLTMPLAGAADAASAALRYVTAAANRVGLPVRVVRLQAMTPAELEAEAAGDDVPRGDVPWLVGPVDESVLPAMHEATRMLLHAGSRRQVIDTVVRLVHRLGGSVGQETPGHPGAFMLGFEVADRPLAAMALDGDAWCRLAQALPDVLDDAGVALRRLEPDALVRRA